MAFCQPTQKYKHNAMNDLIPTQYGVEISLDKQSANYFGLAVGALIAAGIILGIVSGVLISRTISS